MCRRIDVTYNQARLLLARCLQSVSGVKPVNYDIIRQKTIANRKYSRLSGNCKARQFHSISEPGLVYGVYGLLSSGGGTHIISYSLEGISSHYTNLQQHGDTSSHGGNADLDRSSAVFELFDVGVVTTLLALVLLVFLTDVALFNDDGGAVVVLLVLSTLVLSTLVLVLLFAVLVVTVLRAVDVLDVNGGQVDVDLTTRALTLGTKQVVVAFLTGDQGAGGGGQVAVFQSPQGTGFRRFDQDVVFDNDVLAGLLVDQLLFVVEFQLGLVTARGDHLRVLDANGRQVQDGARRRHEDAEGLGGGGDGSEGSESESGLHLEVVE